MAKRKLKKTSPVKTSKISVASSIQKKEAVNPVKSKKKLLIAGGAVVVAAAFLFLFIKNWFLVVLVNNQPITRLDLLSELEKRTGKQTLDSLITKNLILQEERKQKVTVSEKEIGDYIAKISSDLEKQGQKLDDVLKMQGMTKNDLEEQIGIQLAIEKLLGEKVSVTDEEINTYLSQVNPDTKSSPTEEEKNNVREQLKQQKLATEFDSWIANLKKESQIHYFVTF